MKHQFENQNLRINESTTSSLQAFWNSGRILTLILSLALLISCGKEQDCENNPENCPGKNIVTVSPEMSLSQIQEIFITVENGKTIAFEAGEYPFSSHLTLDGKSNVTIQGAGVGNTILSYENQTEGGEGILVTNCVNFEISDLSIKEAKGDGIKVKDSDGVRFIKIATTWKEDKSPDNGAYGIYPVLSKNILIEDCYAKGSIDAGIYVGQSENAIVRDCKAEKNVVGIEVENTIGANIYDNEVTNNAAGILILDLQNLIQSGEHTRVFDNQIEDNNFDNFAEPGTIAALTPAGTGILILASRKAEIFDNEIKDNNIIGVGVVSYLAISALTQEPITDPEFDPYFNEIYLHENTFSKNGAVNTSGQSSLGLLLLQQFGGNPIPHVVTDGIFMPGTGESGGICLNDNDGASFVNLDIANFFANPSFDITPHLCEGQVLSAINLQ